MKLVAGLSTLMLGASCIAATSHVRTPPQPAMPVLIQTAEIHGDARMAEISMTFAVREKMPSGFEVTVFVVKDNRIEAGEGFAIPKGATSTVQLLHVHAEEGAEYVAVVTKASTASSDLTYRPEDLQDLTASGNRSPLPVGDPTPHPAYVPNCADALAMARDACGTRGIASFQCSDSGFSFSCK